MSELAVTEERQRLSGRSPNGNGLRASVASIMVNAALALAKVITGFLGHSYALVADGIESTMDIVSSSIVWGGLKLSARPPDKSHPYGHGKAESLAGVLVSMILILVALTIAWQAINEIRTPHDSPAWFTLIVLALVILVKESMYRFVFRTGDALGSSALKGDAWHHRSDAITSLAAFIGISVALVGGEGFQSADDWAALLACGIILFNGLRILGPALNEVMDGAPREDFGPAIREVAGSVGGVVRVGKCRVRKSGLGLLMDIHILVDGEESVREGHRIGHAVKDALIASELPIHDVMVHVEPDKYDP
jgi:cation diffusion facilitator family transporter